MDYNVQNHLHPYVYEDIKTISDSNVNWPCLENKTVFVTGGNGFIAFYLICAMMIRNDLYNSNINIIALVRNKENAKKKYGALLKRNDIQLIVQDVCQPIKCSRADFIIHAASQASAYYFEHDPKGTIDASFMGAREIFVRALLAGASSIILCHNHPSKDCAPSQADIDGTKKVRDAGELMRIPLLDHIVIGGASYFSFREHDML